MYRSAGGWSQTWALQMGGPARGALGSRGENARPCRDPPDARRTRERKTEGTRDRGKRNRWRGGEGGREVGERDPMVEASNSGISKAQTGRGRKGRGPRGKGGPIKVNHLHYTDRITLSDRTRDPAQGPGCVQSSMLGNRPTEPGPAWSGKRGRHGPRWKAVVHQLMSADCLRGILIRHCAER